MQEIVHKYYGETLTGTQNLRTNACCTDAGLLHGYIERLHELELADANVDVVVSNCVINLAPDNFDFYGNFDQHSGIFPGCGVGIPFNDATTGEQKSGCC